MPLYNGMSGSTGAEEYLRVLRVMDAYLAGPATSARWTSFWDNRTAFWPTEVLHQDYIVGGGEANTAAGWYAYIRRLHGSTRNTSTGGTFGVFGLPTDTWRDFTTQIDTAIAAESTVNDNGLGDIVYAVFISTVSNFQDGEGKDLLAAWAATTFVQESTVGSAAGSS